MLLVAGGTASPDSVKPNAMAVDSTPAGLSAFGKLRLTIWVADPPRVGTAAPRGDSGNNRPACRGKLDQRKARAQQVMRQTQTLAAWWR